MTAAIYETGSANDVVEHPRAWCVVDLDALRHNAARLKQRAGVPLIAMVKADAYGLGAEQVARALDAPWALGVATVAEGERLRASGCVDRIFCCTPVSADELPAMAAVRMIPSLHRAEEITEWTRITEQPWHLSIDTGMNRAGIAWHDVASLRDIVAAHAPQGVYTHFHSAQLDDGSRAEQESRFQSALNTLQLPAGTLQHAANSYALDSAYGGGGTWNLARPGLALYGSPSGTSLALRPVVHVHARIVDLRSVEAGETVSYDATWTATRPSRIATVALGYADGYRRALSNRGTMLVRGHRVPVVGLVTMDLTMLDVTDVSCEVGDVVTALGVSHVAAADASPRDSLAQPVATASVVPDVLTVDEVAASGDLSPYELLTGWRLRLPRVYRQST